MSHFSPGRLVGGEGFGIDAAVPIPLGCLLIEELTLRHALVFSRHRALVCIWDESREKFLTIWRWRLQRTGAVGIG